MVSWRILGSSFVVVLFSLFSIEKISGLRSSLHFSFIYLLFVFYSFRFRFLYMPSFSRSEIRKIKLKQKIEKETQFSEMAFNMLKRKFSSGGVQPKKWSFYCCCCCCIRSYRLWSIAKQRNLERKSMCEKESNLEMEARGCCGSGGNIFKLEAFEDIKMSK